MMYALSSAVAEKPRPDHLPRGIIDCDVHISLPRPDSLFPYMERRFRDLIQRQGLIFHQAFATNPLYTKAHPRGLRRDAYTPEGGIPGSDPAFTARQHLDGMGIDAAMLLPIPQEAGFRDPDLAAAICRAMNEHQRQEWTAADRRYCSAITWPTTNIPAAVAELERCAADPAFTHIEAGSRSSATLYGDRSYWPIYARAEEMGLPVVLHPTFSNSDQPLTNAGWPSFYIEEMLHYSQAYQAHLTDLVLSGVFDAFPRLRVVAVEGGMGWLPALAWRLDHMWDRFRHEVPHLKRKPSDCLRAQVWVTSQPIEEPPRQSDLRTTFDLIGWDRVMFSSDYPHWDTDDPSYVLPFPTSPAERVAFFHGNAREVYRFDPTFHDWLLGEEAMAAGPR